MADIRVGPADRTATGEVGDHARENARALRASLNSKVAGMADIRAGLADRIVSGEAGDRARVNAPVQRANLNKRGVATAAIEAGLVDRIATGAGGAHVREKVSAPAATPRTRPVAIAVLSIGIAILPVTGPHGPIALVLIRKALLSALPARLVRAPQDRFGVSTAARSVSGLMNQSQRFATTSTTTASTALTMVLPPPWGHLFPDLLRGLSMCPILPYSPRELWRQGG